MTSEINLSPFKVDLKAAQDFVGDLSLNGQVSFLARVPIGDNGEDFAFVPSSFNPVTETVHIYTYGQDGWTDGTGFELNKFKERSTALYILACNEQPDIIERVLIEHLQLPFNLHGETDRLLKEQSNGNKDLALFLKQTLYSWINVKAEKLKKAEEKKRELLAKDNLKGANNVQTIETILTQLDQENPQISNSLRVLSLGNHDRLRQLVAEYSVVTSSELQEKKAQVTRAVAEHQLLYKRGVPKAMYVASSYDRDGDPTKILDEEELKKATEKYSPQFAEVSKRYAAATKLANQKLSRLGEHEFTSQLYQKAQLIHEHALEPHISESKGLITTDYSSITLENGVLNDGEVETIEGMPLSWWYDLPVTPLLMKKDFIKLGSAEAGEMSESEIIAENIMRVMESNQISNHGGHVDMSDKVRKEMIDQMRKSIEEGKPIQFELYYSVGAMSNPLERSTRTPSLQDWAMWYKYGQISETIGLFYQPKDSQPPAQWVIIDELQVFGNVWDLKPEETQVFRVKTQEMIQRMGLSNTILFDDLQRMVEEGGKPVQESIAQEYNQITQTWNAFHDAAAQAQQDYSLFWETYKTTLTKKEQGYIQTILDREISMMRLINPLRVDGPVAWDERASGHPNITIDELLHVYNNVMPHVHFEDLRLTNREREIFAVIQARGLHANIYSMAVMNSREYMKRRYPEALKVTITDKVNKMVVFTGDHRVQVFPGHGEAAILYTRSSSIGSPEPGKPWLNVDRLMGSFTDRVYNGEEQRNGDLIRIGDPRRRYTGVIDPETGEITHYIEDPALVYKVAELEV